ncbi:related to PSO2-DNA repair protein [Ramularia collo-cygni]|uniref:Related to PSO2-DNA repair protein n=1 Tax=Ramularia collo-cygni TaxID=112498 RepID=A0A2D3UUM2_9PEZI|nr:related to PSO2-DNA repair protein [Ramularia collo-cygni]CZT16660.1 related to PSO2-DNA repair protein [Ramularia collo-cygni]
MFRKPRTDTTERHGEVLGRAPTPPGTPAKTPWKLAIPPAVPPPKIMAAKTKPKKQTPLPTIGRQGPSSTKKTTSKVKLAGKGNSSILSFFKKSEENEDAGLFVQDHTPYAAQNGSVNGDDRSDEGGRPEDDAEEARFNENGGSVKRRRTSGGSGDGQSTANEKASTATGGDDGARKAGPFFEESDSEQEEEEPDAIIGLEGGAEGGMVAGEMPRQFAVSLDEPQHTAPVAPAYGFITAPTLFKEETSYEPGLGDFADFEDGDFDEDPYEGGDEFMERRYMEEQARLDVEDDEKDYDGPFDEDDEAQDSETTATKSSSSTDSSCPICSVNLNGISEQDAGVHVNNCLDGNPTPLPESKKPSQGQLGTEMPKQAVPANRFKRQGRPPKEGQASPFTLGQLSSVTSGGSAFTKLMSGHAEDAAWAEAAAAEHASRGKPAYTRTCPFYKILPGLFICVDAFRYGAVKGCNAYFLSHFHSDHYIGLSASWRHGPIYCSKVTANLVKQQLRVDPQYVVALDWEVPFEIPGTKGVIVTMISANHCPGSSLFLYEKVVGKKANGEPRQQRILHCGDFRACRMHVEHPLLMPNVMDKVTGKTKEQKLDVCYLDTTYLNPKYAFPEQEAVIKACADMCVCLSKDTPDETDGWEQMKVQRAGKGMAKFIQKESRSDVKEEPVNEDEVDNIKIEKNPHGSQQILSTINEKKGRGRLLVVVGTYSIGKERICLGIARALNSKIYSPAHKQRIVAALEDPELDALMTKDPREAQVHMTPLSEIRAETLDDYLRDFFPHFTRAVGFRPSGWNYRPPNSRFVESPLVQTVLHSDNWKSTYSMRELVPQRGSTSRASCFGVPYSEHSSFRELTMFCCALRIDKIIPTVNIGSAKSRDSMKAWCERWAAERKKNGLYKLPEDGSW